MISIEDPISWDAVDNAITRLASGEYDWIVFTSVNAVEKFLSRLGSAALDTGGAKVAAVGSVTASALMDTGIDVQMVPEEFTGAAVAGAIGPGGGRILLPRVAEGPRGTVDAFTAREWVVDEVVAYRNIPMTDTGPVPDEFDAVMFASGSAARNFAALARGDNDPFAVREPRNKLVVCIGPRTAAAAGESGLPVDVVASRHTDEGMVEALEAHLAATGCV
jgi:uroporphyrinogen III methyltransferase / synthase